MIYYFSATGNSLAMAKQLGEALEDSFQSITRVSEKALQGETIGLVFPVFYGGCIGERGRIRPYP